MVQSRSKSVIAVSGTVLTPRRGRGFEHGVHRCQKRFPLKRFMKDVVCTEKVCRRCDLHHASLSSSSHGDDLGARARTFQLHDDLDPIPVRHEDVGDDKVRGRRRNSAALSAHLGTLPR